MVEQTVILIKKGQALGQFNQGDASEMALYFFASIQGLTTAKLTMNDRFITPSPKLCWHF
ncbi:hypothetical protein [Bacillus sp. JCM 19041]|uniref:hypothetical protein n=1 Tax=Bacillus sp. JCM 19041 TaxID=1460637 RepID=UPI000A6E74AD